MQGDEPGWDDDPRLRVAGALLHSEQAQAGDELPATGAAR